MIKKVLTKDQATVVALFHGLTDPHAAMTENEIRILVAEALLPGCEIAMDGNGQLIIYTDIQVGP